MNEKQTIIGVDFGTDESTTATCIIEYDPDSKQRRIVDVRQGNDAIEYLRNNAPKFVHERESNGRKPRDLVLHSDEPIAVGIDDETKKVMAEAERKAMTRIERDFVVIDDVVPAPDETQSDTTPNCRKRLAQKARARRKKQPGKRRH